jgi:hypothetical protein
MSDEFRRLVNHHRQKIVDIGHQTFFHSLFYPPLEKGGKGGFEDWKSPSIPLCQRGMLNSFQHLVSSRGLDPETSSG